MTGAKQTEVQTMCDQALLALSGLSTVAQAAGDDRIMYAANRAWRDVDAARRFADQDRERTK